MTGSCWCSATRNIYCNCYWKKPRIQEKYWTTRYYLKRNIKQILLRKWLIKKQVVNTPVLVSIPVAREENLLWLTDVIPAANQLFSGQEKKKKKRFDLKTQWQRFRAESDAIKRPSTIFGCSTIKVINNCNHSWIIAVGKTQLSHMIGCFYCNDFLFTYRNVIAVMLFSLIWLSFCFH